MFIKVTLSGLSENLVWRDPLFPSQFCFVGFYFVVHEIVFRGTFSFHEQDWLSPVYSGRLEIHSTNPGALMHYLGLEFHFKVKSRG